MQIESVPAMRDDGHLNVIVETPRGSTIKIKFDAASGLMMLSRPLPSGVSYPYDWGFVAGTHASDGDPLDAMIVWDCTSYPGLLVPSRPIGVLRVEQRAADGQGRQRNDRLLVIPGKAHRLEHVRSIDDLPRRTLSELEQFFVAAVAFEHKDVTLLGWGGQGDAESAVRESVR